jgi:hypothetical protein
MIQWRKEGIMKAAGLPVGAYPAVELKQSPAKLLESHGVSINVAAVPQSVP